MPVTSKNYPERNFTPTVTLVGGAGNTVPVYVTNSGRYNRVGSRVFVDILLTGDGGAEGAGSGVLNIALPIASSASLLAGTFSVGTIINSTEEQHCYGVITAGASTIALKRQSDTVGALTSDIVDAIGDDQNNATRSIRLNFNYEV